MGLYSQSIRDPFRGGFDIGLGASTFIDCKEINNGINFPYLPYQIGIITHKYISGNEFVELGMLFSKRSSSFKYYYQLGGTAIPNLNLYCIDLPIKIYTYVANISKNRLFFYGGLTPSWLIAPEHSAEEEYWLNDYYFRTAYLSVSTGLSYQLKKSRWKLHLSQSLTSIIKPIYHDEINANNELYGSRIFPFEVLLVYGFIFP